MNIKKIILNLKPFKRLDEMGFLDRSSRSLLLLYWLFKILFGLNKDSKVPIHFTSTIVAPGNLVLGKNVHKSLLVSGNCYFQAINGIKIGDDTLIAPGVRIISAGHDTNNLGVHVVSCLIDIGRNCWIGANTVILPGVHIGDNSFIGAGLVLTKSFHERMSLLLEHSQRN
ncbi:lipopolysaccharide O-acetyltransferase [Patescibacteria group bacterium]|nr:lipopolysaccharide O-acetyltransferase [Patescibacteria group bacterium]